MYRKDDLSLRELASRARSFTSREEKGDTLPPRTKLVCTIGPASQSQKVLEGLLKAGMNVARLNFSHGSYEYHSETIANVRAVGEKCRKICGILLDTQGPEIRSGQLKDGEVKLQKGQAFTLVAGTTEEVDKMPGDATFVGVKYPNFAKVLKRGSVVRIDDGLLNLRVNKIEGNRVLCTVLNSGTLGGRKGINLPGVVVDLPAVTEKDKRDLAFGVKMGVDFVAASFVRRAANVKQIRELLGKAGRHIKIISKIENQEGLNNFDEILEASDGIMVARGDLGVEIPIEQVSVAQKMMIRKCNLAGKFVITATQMLESMTEQPSPTRAEASDVANAVFDGTDCVMLSGETAKGKFPELAVQVMRDICLEAEQYVGHRSRYRQVKAALRKGSEDSRLLSALGGERKSSSSSCSKSQVLSIRQSVSSSAVSTSFELAASLILVLTESGTSARLVSRYYPAAPILAVTASDTTARQLMTSRSVFPLLVGSMLGSDSLVDRVLRMAVKLKMAEPGDIVVVTCGREGYSGHTSNMYVVRCGE